MIRFVNYVKMRYIILLILIFQTCALKAQHDTVYVDVDKTTAMLFPEDVLIAEVALLKDYNVAVKGRLVVCRAASTQARTSSLLVRTENSINIWIITYKSNPKKLLWDETKPKPDEVISTKQTSPPVLQTHSNQVSNTEGNSSSVSIKNTKQVNKPSLGASAINDDNSLILIPPGKDDNFDFVLKAKRYIRGIGIKTAGGLYYWLNGIYLDNEFMYMSVSIHNTSQISYDVDFVGFEHKSEISLARKKQTAQEDVVSPPFYYTFRSVAIGDEKKLVYAIPLYAYNEADQMGLKIIERKGDRSLFLKFTGKDIFNAKRIDF